MTLNMLAVGIVVLNIAVALGIYFIDGGIDLPMIVGILYGAVTNTPGLGAAQEALNQLNYTGDPIALGYACAYPLGVVGIIGSIIAIRYICRVNLKKEEDELSTQTSDMKHMPHMLHLEVRNESIDGKKLLQIKEFMGRPFVCSRIRHDGHVSIPNQDTELTDTLRTYIKDRFGFNALEMTSSEIIDKLLEMNDKEAISDLKELFQTADLVKFAKHDPQMNENDANLINAIDFINETKQPEEENQKPQPTEITIIEKRSLRTKILLICGIVFLSAALIGTFVYIGMQLYDLFA